MASSCRARTSGCRMAASLRTGVAPGGPARDRSGSRPGVAAQGGNSPA
jgi:hypothetical protein